MDDVERRQGIRVPFEMRSVERGRACKCTFEPPKRMVVAGSYGLGCATKSGRDDDAFAVDLLLQVPAAYYTKKDYRNLHSRKRAFYLATIAKQLVESRSSARFIRGTAVRYAYFCSPCAADRRMRPCRPITTRRRKRARSSTRRRAS